jgi:hypothetical protein
MMECIEKLLRYAQSLAKIVATYLTSIIAFKCVVNPVRYLFAIQGKRLITLCANLVSKTLKVAITALRNAKSALKHLFVKLVRLSTQKRIISTGTTALQDVAISTRMRFTLAVTIWLRLKEIATNVASAVQSKALKCITLTYLEGLKRPTEKGAITA